MDNKDGRDRILALIEKLRKITLVVQVAPFIYTGLYILIIVTYLFASESVLSVLDTLFYVSPVVIVVFLVESKVLNLCKWHKLACSLPLLPQIEVAFDRYVYECSLSEAQVLVSLVALMAVLLLVAAYKVFIVPKDERKRRTH